jgi:flagellar hook-length control protein FliK
MMSAKTVLTEAPTCPAPAAPTNAASATAPGDAPSDFQNLLAGAAPPVVGPLPAGTTPTQLPLVQLLNLKQQQQAAKTAGAAPVAPAVKQADASADLIKILTDSATLLPAAAADGEPVAADDIPTDVRDADTTVNDDDILSEWIDMMLPPSVFAPQAGATGATGDAATQSGDGTSSEAAKKGGVMLNVIPASLMPQAGLPDTVDAGSATAPGVTNLLMITRDAAAAAATPSPVAAFAAAIINKETTERDKPTNDSWMSAMGDVTGKRGPDMAPVPEARLSTPVHDTRWADALAHRLVLMARDGESVASLKLVPVDLGPLDIQISVRDGEASVHFGAAHQETRAVLEASMPRLRELLSAQGLQLSNATVSHQSGGQNRPERSSAPGAVGAVAEETEVTSAQVISTSLLDTYA